MHIKPSQMFVSLLVASHNDVTSDKKTENEALNIYFLKTFKTNHIKNNINILKKKNGGLFLRSLCTRTQIY